MKGACILTLSVVTGIWQLVVGASPPSIVESRTPRFVHPSGAIPYYSDDNRIIGLVINSPVSGFQGLRKSGFESVTTDFLYGTADPSNELGFSDWSSSSLRDLDPKETVEWLIYVGGLANDPRRIEVLAAEVQHMVRLRACMIQDTSVSPEALRQLMSTSKLKTVVLLRCDVTGPCKWRIQQMVLTKDLANKNAGNRIEHRFEEETRHSNTENAAGIGSPKRICRRQPPR